MVGTTTTSVVKCVSCEGVLLAPSKCKVNKLSLRKSQQGDAKLCACSQPRGPSSNSPRVSKKSNKASIKILDDVVVKPAAPVYENISDSDDDFVSGGRRSKILKDLLSKPSNSANKGKKRKNTKTGDLKKFFEQFKYDSGTVVQKEDVPAVVADASIYDTQKWMQMPTLEFTDAVEGSQSKIMKLTSPSCSQTETNLLFDEPFEFDEMHFENCKIIEKKEEEVLVDVIGREIQTLADEVGIVVVSSSERSTTRGSKMPTPPAVSPSANMPLIGNNVPVTPFDTRQVSPLSKGATAALLPPSYPIASETLNASADEVLNTPVVATSSAPTAADEMSNAQVPTTSSAPSPADEVVDAQLFATSSKCDSNDDDDDDDEIAPTQGHLHMVEGAMQTLRARLAEMEEAKKDIAKLEEKYRGLNNLAITLIHNISSKAAHFAGGHSGVIGDTLELERQQIELAERKIKVLEEIERKAQLIRRFAESVGKL